MKMSNEEIINEASSNYGNEFNSEITSNNGNIVENGISKNDTVSNCSDNKNTLRV